MKKNMRKNVVTILSQITMYLIIIVLYFLLVELFKIENKVLNNILGIGIITATYIITKDKYRISLINWVVGMVISWIALFIFKGLIVDNVFTDVGVLGAGAIVPILGEGIGILKNIGLTLILQMAIMMVVNYIKMNKYLKKKSVIRSSKEPVKRSVKKPENKMLSSWNVKKQEIKEKFKSNMATQKKSKEKAENINEREEKHESKESGSWNERRQNIKEKVKGKIGKINVSEIVEKLKQDGNKKKTYIRASNIITYVLLIVASVGMKIFGLEPVWGETTSNIIIMSLSQFILIMAYIYMKIKYDIGLLDWIKEIYVLLILLLIYNPLNGGIVMIIVDLFKKETMFLSDVINFSRVADVLLTTVIYAAFYLAVQLGTTFLIEKLDIVEEKMQKLNKAVSIAIIQVITGVLLIVTYEHFVLNQIAMTILILAYIVISYIYDIDIVDWFKGMLILLFIVGVYNKYMENAGTYFFSNIIKFNIIISIKIYIIQLIIKEIIYYFMNSETLEKIEIENYD